MKQANHIFLGHTSLRGSDGKPKCQFAISSIETLICWEYIRLRFHFKSFILLTQFFYFSAGAMRLPGGVDDPNKPHFLTNGYITQFGLKIKPFPNCDPNTLTHIYGYPTTMTSGMYALLIFRTVRIKRGYGWRMKVEDEK